MPMTDDLLKTVNKEKQHYFHPTDEKVLLAIPFLGLICMLFHWLWTGTPDWKVHVAFSQYLENIILLNSVHLVLPLVFLATFSQGKAFLSEKTKDTKKRWSFAIFNFLMILLFLACYFWVGQDHWNFFFSNSLNHFFVWFWIIAPAFHGIRQSAGIELAMSRSAVVFSDNTSSTDIVKKEKRILLPMYVFFIMTLIAEALRPSIQNPLIGMCLFAPLILSVLTYITYAFFIHTHKEYSNTNKLYFSVRILLWLFIPYSRTIVWIVMLSHGLEYFALLHKMLQQQNTMTNKTRIISYASVAILAVITHSFVQLTLGYSELSIKNLPLWPPLVVGFFSIFTFLAASHYFIDALIYRMSDTDVRTTIGKSLIGFYSKNT